MLESSSKYFRYTFIIYILYIYIFIFYIYIFLYIYIFFYFKNRMNYKLCYKLYIIYNYIK